MTKLLERYRRNVEKCLQLAQSFNEVEAKRSLLVMANAWLTLAAQREKNINPMPGHESPPPVKPPQPLDDPPKPVPGNDPPEPPIKEPPPVNEPPPQRLNSAKTEDRPLQCQSQPATDGKSRVSDDGQQAAVQYAELFAKRMNQRSRSGSSNVAVGTRLGS